jgi:hypothetical protein
MPHYRRVQPIGYFLNTAPKYTSNGTAWLQNYLGLTDNGSDIDARCRLMLDAVDAAAKSHAVSTEATTLKIFMGPEFYFRGDRGAYPLELLSTITDKLRAKTRESRFRDWLFVFGTMIGALDAGDGVEVFNVSLVLKGGISDPGAKDERGRPYSLVSYKEMISSVDFIAVEGKEQKSYAEIYGSVWGSGKQLLATSGGRTRSNAAFAVAFKPSEEEAAKGPKLAVPSGFKDAAVTRESEDNTSGLAGGALFEMDGIRFGLEVCLDHAFGRIRSLFPSTSDTGLQVQLIPSAGMSIGRANAAVIPGGIVFNVDGGGPIGFPSPNPIPPDADGNPSYIAGAHADVRVFDRATLKLRRLAPKAVRMPECRSFGEKLFQEIGQVAVFPETDLPGLGRWDQFLNWLP